MQKPSGLGAVVAVWMLATSVGAMPTAQHAEAVAERLVGVMETSAQAKANPNAPSVRMTTCPVQLDGSEDIFLYQEQALLQGLYRPYRQRFLRIAPSADGDRVESKSFKPMETERWIGLCDRPERDRVLETSDLSDKGCSVFLVLVEDTYIGRTQTGGCPTNFRGAATITNTIFLYTTGMDTWDRGFDTQGNQVWGAQERPYEFRRLESLSDGAGVRNRE